MKRYKQEVLALDAYQKQLQLLDERIQEVEYCMQGVRGKRYDGIKASPINPEMRFLHDVEKKEELIHQKQEIHQKKLALEKELLNALDYPALEMLYLWYVEKKTLVQLAEIFCVSPRAISFRMQQLENA